MSSTSKIEWTDGTWNPVRGCTKVSPGCKFCYAATFAERWRGIPGHAYEQGFDLRLVPEMLSAPLKWVNPKKIFVNSMADLFHEGVPDDYIERVCKTMMTAEWHSYQILTKRSERMARLLTTKLRDAAQTDHIWWGVSVEDRRHGLPRIDHLRDAAPRVGFLSVEPLLEDLGHINLDGVHWLIAGGESGPHARPVKADWVRSLRDQCVTAGVPFMFKQWGGTRKHLTGRELDGRTWDQYPPLSSNPVPSLSERKRLVAEMKASLVTA